MEKLIPIIDEAILSSFGNQTAEILTGQLYINGYPIAIKVYPMIVKQKD